MHTFYTSHYFLKRIAVYTLVIASFAVLVLSGFTAVQQSSYIVLAQENENQESSSESVLDFEFNLQGETQTIPGVPETSSDNQGATGDGQGATGGGQGVQPGDTAQTELDEHARLKNPLDGTVGSIPDLVKTILEIAMMIAVPIVALAIIYSGFLFVAAQGNKEKLEKARQTFFYTIIGGALVLGAVVIANAIAGTIDQLRA